ncbi:hypothetical protein BCR44DRAFT_1434038, partial [Catenaria anguillulae PL171]
RSLHPSSPILTHPHPSSPILILARDRSLLLARSADDTSTRISLHFPLVRLRQPIAKLIASRCESGSAS